MKKIYTDIRHLAKPYYEQWRPMDIDHIERMMWDATLVCEKEWLDDTILLPLVILHDVGYARVPKDNPFNIDMRQAHMKAGAEIAQEILEKISYPQEKTEKVVHYVSIHDNRALGDNASYTTDKILGTFNDLDYMRMATPKWFPSLMHITKKNQTAMYEHLQNNEKPIQRPFNTHTTKKLYETYMHDRKKEYSI